MAALSLNVRYKPMSYDEYMRPFLMYHEAYENMANNMDTLADETTKYSQYIQPGTKAYSIQQQYLQQFNDVNNKLHSEGMNRNLNANTVRGLKKTFREQIAPINQAAQQLDTMNKTLYEMRLKNHHIIVDKMPNIDDIMNNPSSLPHLIDGQDVQKNSMGIAAAMAKEMDPGSPEMIKHGYFIDVVTRRGGNPEQKLYAYQNLLQSPYFQNLFKQYGINENTNPEVIQQVLSYIKTGFAQGFVGETEHKMIEDPVEKANLSLRNSMALSDHDFNNKVKLEMLKTNMKNAGNGSLYRRAGAMDLSLDVNSIANVRNRYPEVKYKNKLDEYIKNGLMDSNYILTQAGINKLKTDKDFSTSIQAIAQDFGAVKNGQLLASDLSKNIQSAIASKRTDVKSEQMMPFSRPVSTKAEKDKVLGLLQIATASGSASPTLYEPGSYSISNNGEYTIKANKKTKMDIADLAKGIEKGKISINNIGLDDKSGQIIIYTIDDKGKTTPYFLDKSASKAFMRDSSYSKVQGAILNVINSEKDSTKYNPAFAWDRVQNEVFSGIFYEPENDKTEFDIMTDYEQLMN